MRMESRRQVTVSWDSGGSDEAPPKLSSWGSLTSPVVSGYPGSHGIPAMAGSIYPGQASLLDQTDSWNHRPQEISVWQPNMEDSGTLDIRGMGQVLPTHLMEERLIRQQQEMEEDQRWLEKEERFLVKFCFVVLLNSFCCSLDNLQPSSNPDCSKTFKQSCTEGIMRHISGKK
uniref:Uncharacterized protein n=1 Tax=Anas zonorhyncha TaxID=75864 RepID=A0A8B9UXI6_9AVES